MKQSISSVLAFLKFLVSNKETRPTFISFLLLTPLLVYVLIIKFYWWDIILYPLSVVIGVRIGLYGWLGLIPGGGIIAERHFHTIHFWPVLKTWRTRWMFLRENNFSVDFYYIQKEMYKGDPTSVREVTGPAAVTIGIGFNKYLFDLE